MSIIAKYKFDKSIYADLLPEFNAEFTSDKYNTTDEEVDGIITRTIESDELPTLMRFGRVWVDGEPDTDNVIEAKLVQPLNILCILVTFLVSKLLKSNEVNVLQLENI